MKRKMMRAALGVSLISILLGIFAVLDYLWYMNGKIRQQTVVELDVAMEEQVSEVNEVIEIQRNLLQTLANQIVASKSLGDKAKEIQTMNTVLDTDEFFRVGVTGLDGICHYMDHTGEGYCDISEREYFKSTMETEEWSMGGPYTSLVAPEEPCFVISVPLLEDGEVIGVLHGTYSIDRFAELLLSEWKGDDRAGFLVDGDGSVLVGYTERGTRLLDEGNIFEIYGEGTDFLEGASYEDIRESVENGENGYALIEHRGNKRYVSYRTLGYRDWYMLCVLPQAAVDSHYQFISEATMRMVVKLLIAGALGVAAVLLFHRNAYKSLEEQKKQLEKSEERYRLMEEKSNEGLFEYSVKSGCFYVGESFQRIFGIDNICPENEMREIVHPDDRLIYDKLLKSVKNGEALYDVEMRMAHVGEADYGWYCIRSVEDESQDEKRTHIVGKAIDITRQKKHIDALKQKTQVDFLTQIYNRESIIGIVEKRLEQNLYKKQALLLFDMDHFKEINDTYGHEMGDRSLQYFASLLKSYFRRDDIVGRLGGDEFVTFLSGIKGEEQLLVRLKEFCDFLEKDEKAARYHIESCSIGVAISPEHGTSFAELYKNADTAMYRAKADGGKKAVVFDGKMQ